MKTSILVLVTAFLFSLNAFAQGDLLIGQYDPNTSEVTLVGDGAALKAAFAKHLNVSDAQIGDLEFIFGFNGIESKFLVGASVEGSPDGVGYISRELEPKGNELYVGTTGPGITHTCKGNPCTSCTQNMDGKLRISCACEECSDCSETPRCDHTVTATLGF